MNMNLLNSNVLPTELNGHIFSYEYGRSFQIHKNK